MWSSSQIKSLRLELIIILVIKRSERIHCHVQLRQRTDIIWVLSVLLSCTISCIWKRSCCIELSRHLIGWWCFTHIFIPLVIYVQATTYSCVLIQSSLHKVLSVSCVLSLSNWYYLFTLIIIVNWNQCIPIVLIVPRLLFVPDFK